MNGARSPNLQGHLSYVYLISHLHFISSFRLLNLVSYLFTHLTLTYPIFSIVLTTLPTFLHPVLRSPTSVLPAAHSPHFLCPLTAEYACLILNTFLRHVYIAHLPFGFDFRVLLTASFLYC